MEMQRREPKLVMEVRASDFHKTGADSQFVILKMKSGELKKTSDPSLNTNISFRTSKRRIVEDGVAGFPKEDLVKLVTFFTILYGVMAGIFIGFYAANAGTDSFGVMWAFFGIFLAFAAFVVYLAVMQYQRSLLKATMWAE